MATKLSDNERHGLSDEELEALDAEDDTPKSDTGGADDDDDTTSAGADEDTDTSVPGSDDDDDDEPAADDSKPADADAAAKPAAAQADGAKPAGEDDATATPAIDEIETTLEAPPIALVEVPDVANYEAERGVLLDERKQLRTQHRDGDISSDEYDEKLDALNDKLQALDRSKADADSATRQNEAVQRAQYLWTIDQVKRDFKSNDAIDYDTNPVLMQMWDTKVKALAKDEANASKSAEWFLRAAHKQVLDEVAKIAGGLGFSRGDAQPAEGEKKPAAKPAVKPDVKAAVKARRPGETKLKGVGELPVASAEGIAGDEFSDLDNLSGVELERALAKMPEERAAKYLMG